MILKTKRKLEVAKNMQINCKVWKKQEGYLAYTDCEKLKALKLTPIWESRYPAPETYCGPGDCEKDSRCAVPVPGFGHPHVFMMDDYFYTLNIDLL